MARRRIVSDSQLVCGELDLVPLSSHRECYDVYYVQDATLSYITLNITHLYT